MTTRGQIVSPSLPPIGRVWTFTDLTEDSPTLSQTEESNNPCLVLIQRFTRQPTGIFLLGSFAFVLALVLSTLICMLMAEPATEDPSRVMLGTVPTLFVIPIAAAGTFLGFFVVGSLVAIPASGVFGGIAGGVLARGKIHWAAIGPCLLSRRDERLTVRYSPSWFLHGAPPQMISKEPDRPLRIYKAVLAGHALGIAALGLLSLIVFIGLGILCYVQLENIRSSGLGMGLGFALAVVTLITILIFVACLKVTMATSSDSSIRYLRDLGKDDDSGEALRDGLVNSAQSAVGVRPRDWPEKQPASKPEEASESTQNTRSLLDYWRALDRGDVRAAGKILDEIRDVYTQSIEADQSSTTGNDGSIASELAFFAAYYQNDVADAERWLTESASFLHLRWTRLRAEAAWLLVMGDPTNARERAERALELLRDYLWLDPGQMTAEAIQLEMLIERARAAEA